MRIFIYDSDLSELDKIRIMLEEHKKQELILYTENIINKAQNEFLDKDLDLIIIALHMMKPADHSDELEFAGKAAKTYPHANIIFISDDYRYAGEAFKVDASGYLTRPLDAKALIHQMDRLRYVVHEKHKRVRFRCFGNFEAYIDEQPIKFQYTKTKEMLAFLVDRHGVFCKVGELIATLWQDDGNHLSYFKTIRKDLYDTLENYECDELIIKRRNEIGLNLDCCECDYYEWEKDRSLFFGGEYMSQYSWAEYTGAYLLRINMKPQDDDYIYGERKKEYAVN